MSRESGFSLVEILVASFVFAVIGAISVALMASTLTAQTVNEDALRRTADIDRLRVLLREDIGQIALRPMRDAQGFTRPYIFAGDTDGLALTGERSEDQRLLVFTRHGRANPGNLRRRSSLVYVEYRLRDGDLIRMTREYPDQSDTTLEREQILLSGVERLEVDFLLGVNWSSRVLVPVSTDGATLPPAIRLRYDTPGLGEMEHIVLTAEALR